MKANEGGWKWSWFVSHLKEGLKLNISNNVNIYIGGGGGQKVHTNLIVQQNLRLIQLVKSQMSCSHSKIPLLPGAGVVMCMLFVCLFVCLSLCNYMIVYYLHSSSSPASAAALAASSWSLSSWILKGKYDFHKNLVIKINQTTDLILKHILEGRGWWMLHSLLPRGVEKVRCMCITESKANDQDNNTLWSTFSLIVKALYKKQLLSLLSDLLPWW